MRRCPVAPLSLLAALAVLISVPPLAVAQSPEDAVPAEMRHHRSTPPTSTAP